MPIIRRAIRPRRVARKKRVVRRRPILGMRRRPNLFRSLNANRQDRAVVVETQELTATPEGGNFIGHQLDQYARALAVSKNYRYYKCKKVEIEFVPYANVFAPGTAYPELYFQVDRTQGVANPGVPLPLPTKNMMLARGCMPIKWTSPVRKAYVPSVCRVENFYQNIFNNDVIDVIGVTTTPVFNKWYATQQYYAVPPNNQASPMGGNYSPQSLRWFGAAYFINQDLAAPSQILGTIKMRVHWEFKEPLWTQDTEVDLSGNQPEV